jgi:hypothetical protein
MINTEKIIETAKKLGIEVIEETENPGFFVLRDQGVEPLDAMDILKTCTLYTDEELSAIFEMNTLWVGISKVKTVSPRTIDISTSKMEFVISSDPRVVA